MRNTKERKGFSMIFIMNSPVVIEAEVEVEAAGFVVDESGLAAADELIGAD
jgi:hypothetical protein